MCYKVPGGGAAQIQRSKKACVRHGLISPASLPAPAASPSLGRKGPCRSPDTVRAHDHHRERKGRRCGPRLRPSARLNGEGARAAHARGCHWEERPPSPHGCCGGGKDGGDGNFRGLNAHAPRNLEERVQGLCCRRPRGRCRAPRSPPALPPTRSGDRRRRHCASRCASLRLRRRPPPGGPSEATARSPSSWGCRRRGSGWPGGAVGHSPVTLGRQHRRPG